MGIGKMNVQVKFFAQLREQLDCDECTFELPIDNALFTVETLKSELGKKSPTWKNSLDSGKVLMAVNHELVGASYVVKADDEVAFFPPVTGG